MKLLTRYGLSLFILCMMGSSAHASNNWLDMWRNTNQRAAAHLEQGQFDAAEKLFTRKDWQAIAAYRNKHYAAAEKGFQAQGGAEGLYNQGNALAYQAKYKQAIEAYKQALKREPKHLDAQHNLAVLEEMLKKNPPESESKSNNSDQSNQPEDSDQKQDKGKPNQEKAPDNQNGANNTPSQPDSAPENSSEQSPPESEQPSDKSPEQPTEPEPKSEPKSEADSKAEAKAEAKAKQDEQAQPNPQQANASATDAEQQAKEQWLRLIPDDPGGLLREKFWRDHMKRLQQRHV